MPEQTVTGVCTEIAQRPGSEWTEFHIDVGSQYPIRLSTKKQPLIELGRAAGQQLATWTYNESESEKINEKSGKPYVNRYLESVTVGGGFNQPDATASPTSAPHHQPLIAGDKDRAITRMACLKAATVIAENIKYNQAETDIQGAVMATAARFEKWVYRDIDEVPFE